MTKIKVEFKLLASPPHQDALDGVKVGDVLDLHHDDAAKPEEDASETPSAPVEGAPPLSCHVAGGAVAGVVPPTVQRRFPPAAQLTATVRSVQRDPVSGCVSQILLRVELSENGGALPAKAAPAAPVVSVPQAEEVDFEHQLRRSHLESLVGDKDLALMLRDPRLQHLLTQIDAGPSREKAIDNALEQVDFRTFADKLLGTLSAHAEELKARGA